jgi:hypothetical protein
MSARVLMTRWNRALPGTGFNTGAPSIGTRIAGELLMMTCGGALLTSTVAGLIPAAASDASSLSSDIVRTLDANSFVSSGP